MNTKFYDLYHKKNKNFYKVINKNNFTYFYIMQFLEIPCVKTSEKKLILDVGCGVGALSLFLAKLGHNVTGIDISNRAVDIANSAKKSLKLNNIIFKKGILKKGKENFDLVICSEIIEHVKDDKAFLSLVNSNLKKDGLLILTTPSKENLLYRIGFYKKFDKEVGHLRRYKEQELEKLINNNKYEVVKIRGVEGPLRNILFTTKLGFLIKFIKGPLVPIFHIFDRISANLFGASDIQVVAKKI